MYGSMTKVPTRKDDSIMVRLTPEYKRAFRILCERLDVGMSDFTRRAIYEKIRREHLEQFNQIYDEVQETRS